MVNRYKTKPVEIEALEWNGDNFKEVKEFTDNKAKMELLFSGKEVLVVQTLEGDMAAAIGDFIIKGLRGEFYPCKPDVFHKKYEKIE